LHLESVHLFSIFVNLKFLIARAESNTSLSGMELTKAKEAPVPEVLNLLKGGDLTKCGRRGRPGKRAIILSADKSRLNWTTNSFFKGTNATSGKLWVFWL
jgi:hypothetical protein